MNTKIVKKQEVEKIISEYLTDKYFLWELAETIQECVNNETSFDKFFQMLRSKGQDIKEEVTFTGDKNTKVFIQDKTYYLQNAIDDTIAFEDTYEECAAYREKHNLNAVCWWTILKDETSL